MEEVYNRYNPWYYLGGSAATMEQIAENYGYLISSIFITLRVVGVLGAAITLVIAFARYAAAHPYERADVKKVISGKVLVVILLFGSSWLMSLILGILLTI